MRYGVAAATRPDSLWGRTLRWRCDRYGRPLAFGSETEAQEAAKAFNDQQGLFDPVYENTAVPLEQSEVRQ